MTRNAYFERCRECGADFEARNARATYCSDACRARARRARQAAAVDLLVAQTRAIVRGDSAEVERTTHEAERLLGDDV